MSSELTTRDASAAPAREPKKPVAEDEDEIALPPFDDEDEADESQLDVGDLLSTLDNDDADPFDDSTAADLETGLDIGLSDEGSPGDDEAAEEGVDVGGLEDDLLVQDEGVGAMDDRLDAALDEDEDLASFDRERSEDDGGAEGTLSHGEDDVSEADLPELDADEEGDHEAEDVVAEMTFAADTSLPPWDTQRWSLVEGAGAAVPCSALAVGRGKVAAAGEVLLLVGEEAHAASRSGFEAGARAVAIADDGAIVAAARGELWVSRDDGKTVSALGGFRGSTNAAVLAATPGRVWIVSDGALSSIPTAGGPATPIRLADVARIAAAGEALVALSRSAKGPLFERLGGEEDAALHLEDAAARAAADDRVVLAAAAGGRLLALASPEAVCVSRDGGKSFRTFSLPGTAALTFAGDHDEAPLLALLVPPLEEEAYMALLPAEGSPSLIAELAGGGSLEDDAEEGTASIGTAAIGWDAAREVVWIACRAGLLALARARKH
jgi:hypothetical protein